MIENTQNNQDNPQKKSDSLSDAFNVEFGDDLWDAAPLSDGAMKEPSATPTVESDSFWGGLDTGDIWDDLEASVTNLEASLGVKQNHEETADAKSDESESEASSVSEEKVTKIDIGDVLDSLAAASGVEVTAAADATESATAEVQDSTSESSESDRADEAVKPEASDADEFEMASVGDDNETDEDADDNYAFSDTAFSSMDITTVDENAQSAEASSSEAGADDLADIKEAVADSQTRREISEIAKDEGRIETPRSSAAVAELEGLLRMERGETEDSGASEQPDNDEDTSDEVDEEDDGVRLSERARLGRVIPEGEVIASEHELGHDVYYSESECGPAVKSSNHVVGILVSAAIVLIAVAILALLFLSHDKQPEQVAYIQKGAFQLDNNQFKHLYFSSEKNHIAMCSDQRGVVMSGGHLVSEFWPGMGGCVRVRLSDDGSKVWYLDHDNHLFEVNLTAGFGFNAKQIADLTGIVGDHFFVSNGEVSYFVELEDSKQAFRHLNLESGKSTDTEIADDALPCSGFTNRSYAFVSKDSIHLFDENGVEKFASLEAPKYGCSRVSALSCTQNGSEDWVVLCKDSIRQGKGKQALSPVPYTNVALRSGAAPYSLIRHSDGTELVTKDQWIRLDNRNTMNSITLKQPLGKTFEVAYHTDEKMPLLGLSDGIVKFEPDGTVKTSRSKSSNDFAGAAFVGDGQYAITLSSNKTEGKSKVLLWSLQEGRLVNSMNLDAVIERINISRQGNVGFIMNELTGHVFWIHWLTGERMGDMVPGLPIVDALWSADEKHVLLYYGDNSSELFEVSDKTVNSLRKYSPDAVISFASNDLLWHIEDSRVFYERISDGASSVINERLTDQLGDMEISHILAHPYSDDVLFWGPNGIWRYNSASNRLNLIANDEVSWVFPDHAGKFVATSIGLIQLDTLEVSPYPEIPNHTADQPLRWLGLNQYLQTEDGRTVVDWQIQRVQNVLPDVGGLRFIGSNGGEHPNRNLILAMRDNILSLEQLQPNAAPRTVSVFGGGSSQSWCWISSNGEIQVEGDMCTSFHKNEEGKSLLVASNPAVASSMNSVFSGDASIAFKHAPIEFVDEIKLSITTVPEDAFLIFAASEGDLPESLTFEDGLTSAPFSTQLKLDPRWFALVVTAGEDYENRTLLFRPDRESLSMRIPLLPTQAADVLKVNWYEPGEIPEPEAPDAAAPDAAAPAAAPDAAAAPQIVLGDALEVSEDLNIEMTAMMYHHAEDLSRCLRKQSKPRHLLLTLHEDQIVIADPSLDETTRTCLAPVLDDVAEQRKNGALPELTDMSNVMVDVQLLK